VFSGILKEPYCPMCSRHSFIYENACIYFPAFTLFSIYGLHNSKACIFNGGGIGGLFWKRMNYIHLSCVWFWLHKNKCTVGRKCLSFNATTKYKRTAAACSCCVLVCEYFFRVSNRVKQANLNELTYHIIIKYHRIQTQYMFVCAYFPLFTNRSYLAFGTWVNFDTLTLTLALVKDKMMKARRRKNMLCCIYYQFICVYINGRSFKTEKIVNFPACQRERRGGGSMRKWEKSGSFITKLHSGVWQ